MFKLVRLTLSSELKFNIAQGKQKEIQNRFRKLTICLFLLFLCLVFSLPWKKTASISRQVHVILKCCFCETFSLLHSGGGAKKEVGKLKIKSDIPFLSVSPTLLTKPPALPNFPLHYMRSVWSVAILRALTISQN